MTEPEQPRPPVHHLLTSMAAGDDAAASVLFRLVYHELREMADAYLGRERAGHTLQATALVHEAYLRLVDQRNVQDADRSRFFAMAATAMRRVLIDHARGRKALKRGEGAVERLTIDEVAQYLEQSNVDLLALDEALTRLGELDPVQSRLVELRFFGGMSMQQAAGMLEISERTAHREWATARAWLRSHMDGTRDDA